MQVPYCFNYARTVLAVIQVPVIVGNFLNNLAYPHYLNLTVHGV